MNMSMLMSNLKMDTGISFITLPLDDFDNRIKDMITSRTVRTFSQFFPQKKEVIIELAKLPCVKSEYTENIYELDHIEGRRVIAVDNVRMNDYVRNGAFFDPVGDIGIGTYTDMMLAQASADLISLATPPFTFQFEQPNLLHIYNLGTIGYTVIIEALVEHAHNLSSIPFTMEESFYELALIDFKRFLYSNLKHFNEIQTVNGTINLRIDEWQNAESERKELLDKWTSIYHLDRRQIYYI